MNGLLFTNVEKDCPIIPLIHDMVLEDFIVEGLGLFLGGRHVLICSLVE